MVAPKGPGRGATSSPVVREVDDAAYGITESTRLLGGGRSDSQNGSSPVETRGAWDGDKDFEGLSWRQKPSVAWLLTPYIIFTLAFGGVMVPKLNLILSLVCKQYFADRNVADPTSPAVPIFLGSDNPQCRIPEVQSRVSEFILVFNLITGLLSALTAPKIGKLSDRYGRTKLMAIASAGGLFNEIITVLAAQVPNAFDYRWLILGAIADGLSGSFTAGSILSQSYTSDCTPPSRRAVSIGYVHSCLFTGLALGPLFAGYLVKWTGSMLPIFYIIIGCHLFFIVFMGFVVPDSLSKRRQYEAREKHKKEEDARAESMGTWLSTIQTTNPFEPLRNLWPTGSGTSFRLRLNLVTLAVTDMIILGSSMTAGPVIILYSGFMFHWGTVESSFFISALAMVRVVALLGIMPIVNYIFRIRPARKRREEGIVDVDRNAGAEPLDVWVIRVALASEILGCVGYFFTRNENIFFVSGMMTALGGLGSATIQATVTKHVPADRIGQVLGAIGMLHALTRVVGPIMFNGIYAGTVGTFPQAFLLVLGSFFVSIFLASFILKPRVHWDTSDEDEAEPTDSDPDIATANRLPIDDEQSIIH